MAAGTSAVTTVLGLTLLRTLTVGESPTRVGQLLNDVNHLIERALDPNVPAIPDRSVHGGSKGLADPIGKTPATPTPSTSTKTPTTTPRLPVPGQQRAV